MEISFDEIKELLNAKVKQFNNINFIEPDPISIPHRYSRKEDIEISGFLASTIAWGNRKMIVKNGHRMLDMMGESPFDFVMSHNEKQLKVLDGFVHRTFNSDDLKCFVRSLRHIYQNHEGLEAIFANNQADNSVLPAISVFKKIFFENSHLQRTEKHVADPEKGSVAKRINLWLRWMVRKDKNGVDFGIWDSISPSKLSCPLDVHSGNVARKLGLITRTQNDLHALAELDAYLRKLDPADPVKYDFALFGLGINEKF